MGTLHVITGPMFSGKTETLLRYIRRAKEAQLEVAVFTPEIDSRYGVGNVHSHSGQRLSDLGLQATPLSADVSTWLCETISSNIQVVAFDEVQFFPKGFFCNVQRLLKLPVKIYAAGLDRDYLDQPFGPMPELLAYANVVEKLTAICQLCKTDNACMTFRKEEQTGPQVVLGAQETYCAMCRPCYTLSMTKLINQTTRS